MTVFQKTSSPLLDIEDLGLSIESKGEKLRVLNSISLSVYEGQAVGLVGESGSGKSMLLRTVIGLLPKKAHIDSGSIIFNGEELVDNPKIMAKIRGAGISMVFQEPAVALNPIMKVGTQITDGLQQHMGLSRKTARVRAIELMEQVGIVEAERRVDSYPFELSGGMRQRVMIASAIACKPKLILCDEPTTALDVTVQRQIIDLFNSLRREMGVSLLYVTHDMAVVANLCDHVTVMYSGSVMEQGTVSEVFSKPMHPYTKAMLKSTPLIDGPLQRLSSIPGTAPSLSERPKGCPFAPRCQFATDSCSQDIPVLHVTSSGRKIACVNLPKEAKA